MKKGVCKHKTSTWHDEHCKAGVRYDDVCPRPADQLGKAYRYPCTKRSAMSDHGRDTLRDFGSQGTCAKFEEPTDEEISRFENELRAAADRIEYILPVICRVKAEHAGESWQGTEPCPVCGGAGKNKFEVSQGEEVMQCGNCNGKGVVGTMSLNEPYKPCEVCGGKGWLVK